MLKPSPGCRCALTLQRFETWLMNQSLSLSLSFILVFGFNTSLQGDQVIANYDFEGGNDLVLTSLSDGGLVPITTDSNSANGNGSEGAEFTVATTTFGATFATGYLVGIQLFPGDSRFAPGGITVDELDDISVVFDMETIGDGVQSARFEASIPGGDYANRVDFGSPSGTWGSYVIDFVTLDPTQKMNLVSSMNVSGVTSFNLVFDFRQNASGEYVAGSSFRVDNLLVTSVPEAHGFALLVLGGLGVLRLLKRRRGSQV